MKIRIIIAYILIIMYVYTAQPACANLRSTASIGHACLNSYITTRDADFRYEDRRLYDKETYTIEHFTNLTPEKFLKNMPGVIATIRGYPLTEDEYVELERFSLLLAEQKERLFHNYQFDNAKTLAGLKWLLINGRTYQDNFPYVCYECMLGVSLILAKHNIPHRRLCNITNNEINGPQNFVVVSLAGVEFMIDLTFRNENVHPRETGIVIFPLAFMEEEPFRKNMYFYVQCPRNADVSIDHRGNIDEYSFYDHTETHRRICYGKVGKGVEYTVVDNPYEDKIGRTVRIKLTDFNIDVPFKFVTIREDDDGNITVFLGKHIDTKRLEAIKNVETVVINRVYGETVPQIEIKITHINGTEQSFRFKDPKYSTYNELYTQDSLAQEGMRLKEEMASSPELQVNTTLINCERVKKNIPQRLPTMSAFSDEALKKSLLWDDDTLHILRDRFPDGELYLRALNAEKIRDKDVVMKYSINSDEALLEQLFIIDILKQHGARSLTLYVEDWENVYSKTERFLLGDMLTAAAKRKLPFRVFGKIKDEYKKIEIPKQIGRAKHDFKRATKVIAIDPRMSETAQKLAERLGITATTITPFDPASEEKIRKLSREHVVIVHSMSTNEMTENLLKILPRLQRVGVNSLALALTYLSYARQDKNFPEKTGEAVSANAIVEYLDYFTDEIYAITTHVTGTDAQGPVRMGEAVVYNLNGFTQLVEYSFALIKKGITEKIANDLKDRQFVVDHDGATTIDVPHEIIKQKLIEEFTERPIYIIGPDQGSALAAEQARAVLQARLLKKYGITGDDVKVKVRFLEKERLSSREVRIRPRLFRFLRDENNKIKLNRLNKPAVPKRLSEKEKERYEAEKETYANSWVFLVDDEISTGGTTKSALYVLVHELGFKAHRIMTSWVHGKFPEGLAPIVHHETYSADEVVQGIASGELLREKRVVDEAAMTDHAKREMMPFFIATTNSYYSKGAVKKVIDLLEFVNVNLFRLFAFGLSSDDGEEALLQSA
ncbi:hypothetical protein ACFL3D_01110 [Candidatus Omnitrophota bacterium]